MGGEFFRRFRGYGPFFLVVLTDCHPPRPLTPTGPKGSEETRARGNLKEANTMIAKNIRKYAEAAALQLVLPFGRPVWALTRPTTRLLRAIRSARAKLIASRPQIVTWEKPVTPQWVRDAIRRAKRLAAEWALNQFGLC